MLELLIHHGTVVDGSGASRFRADVGVLDGRIVELDNLEGALAEKVIDAQGCVVTPGFVDMHSHADFSLPVLPTADSLLCQGITTAVIGQCGFSPAPLLDGSRERGISATPILADIPVPWEEWSTFGSYLAYLSRIGISLNVVSLVGHGTVRAGVMGFGADPPSEEQMVRMQVEVVKAMESGAAGVSTGLIYPPGSYARIDELMSFTRPAAERDGYYFSHIRGEGATLLDAVAEAIRIGRETGASVQISHFKAAGKANWDKAIRALELIDQARQKGLDVTTDMYPYLAGSTGLVAALPQWAQEGGKEAILKRLPDAESRRRMIADMMSADFFRITEWDAVVISGSPRNRGYEGRDVADMAAEAGKSPHGWVFDALIETELELEIAIFEMSEENRKLALRHPAMMIGTDGFAYAIEGPLSRGMPHPRSYGTYPRLLGHYVREQKTISLEEAIWKASGYPAEKLRWTDRGLVKKGYCADLVVLNPDIVVDQATYQAPHQYPAGINHVIVNGDLVVHHGAHTLARPGIVL